MLAHIQAELRDFFGQTAFEELAQGRTAPQGHRDGLPFAPQAVGSHCSQRVEVDAVALDCTWPEMMMGECKWGGRTVAQAVVSELINDKTPRLLQDIGQDTGAWRVHYAIFSCLGLTDAAHETLHASAGWS